MEVNQPIYYINTMKYKRFILFQYDSHDSVGGLNDITGSYDAIEDAILAAGMNSLDYNEIVDRDTWELVWPIDASNYIQCPHCYKIAMKPSAPGPYRCCDCNQTF